MPFNWKKWLSYFYPIVEYKHTGEVTECLELRWEDGSLKLNSSNANYSFGDLHRLFQTLFTHIDVRQYTNGNILLLGVAGGSVIHILRKEWGIRAPITAVEKDATLVEIGKQHFGLGDYADMHLVLTDAAEFMHDNQQKFSLIIIDLFIETTIPQVFLEDAFLADVCRALSDGGMVCFNHITEFPDGRIGMEGSKQYFQEHLKEVKLLHPFPYNVVITAKG
jgi:spermidine synthase